MRWWLGHSESLTYWSPKTLSLPFQFAIQTRSGFAAPPAMSRIVEAALPYTPGTSPCARSSAFQPPTNARTAFEHAGSPSLYPSMSNHTGLPDGSPRAAALEAASSAAARPCDAAVVAVVETFASPDCETHGACSPTYSGSRLPPRRVAVCAPAAVRFGWSPARLPPPM